MSYQLLYFHYIIAINWEISKQISLFSSIYSSLYSSIYPPHDPGTVYEPPSKEGCVRAAAITTLGQVAEKGDRDVIVAATALLKDQDSGVDDKHWVGPNRGLNKSFLICF